jgi:ubiquinone/menaquinone biosynthesis C-methylase UbiE
VEARREKKLNRKIINRALFTLGLQFDSGDDSNHWWQRQFQDYCFIPKTISSAIEVGCGPYTNIRLIREGRQFGRIVCSDPLADTYLTFKHRWLAVAKRRGWIEVNSSPAEALPFPDEVFDLTIMINVLDHVQDAVACLDTVKRITSPGGLIVIGQDLTNDDDRLAMEGDHMHLAGHTVFIKHDEIESYLPDTGFSRVYRRMLSREEGRWPPYHYGTLMLAIRKIPVTGRELDNL